MCCQSSSAFGWVQLCVPYFFNVLATNPLQNWNKLEPWLQVCASQPAAYLQCQAACWEFESMRFADTTVCIVSKPTAWRSALSGLKKIKRI